MNVPFNLGSKAPWHSEPAVETSISSRSLPRNQAMLKKTLIATVAISATLFAIAAVRPTLAQPQPQPQPQPRSEATSSAPASKPSALNSAPGQDKGQRDHERDHKRDHDDSED